MNILCVGDVVGSAGCAHLRRLLPVVKRQYAVDLCIVNGENAAGNGVLRGLAEGIGSLSAGALKLILTLFTAYLAVAGGVSGNVDRVALKTAKFAVSSGVPIVGGTISDAVNTVHASLSLMHSSIGTYGIAAGIVILLPSLISVVCYRFALTAAEAVSEVFGVKELSTLFRACGAVMSIIMAVIVCFLLLNTISAVIMLAAGSSQA